MLAKSLKIRKMTRPVGPNCRNTVQPKDQYSLDRQIAKILALSSGNISKQEFLTRYVLPVKGLLERAGTIKSFEY